MSEPTPSHTEWADALRRAASDLAQGRVRDAEVILKAIAVDHPDEPDVVHLLGTLYLQTERLDEAIKTIGRAIAIKDDNPAYHHNLGLAHRSTGSLTDAEAAFRRAVKLGPDVVDYYIALGITLQRQTRYDEAAAVFLKAANLQPSSFEAQTVLAMVWEEQGCTEKAEAGYRKALKFGETPTLYFNLGNVLKDQHRADEAEAAYARAIELMPDYAEAHVHRAFSLLLKGNLLPAWEEYEWRWKVPAFTSPRRTLTVPQWRGEPLNGCTLLIHAEQGFGDAVQFIRYTQAASKAGGRIVVECHESLSRLIASAPSVDEVTFAHKPLPPIDLHIPLLSLPSVFRTTLKTIPADIPYLAADPVDVKKWRKRFSVLSGLKIGIAWRGSAERRGNPPRACSIEHFRPILECSNVHLFSLQKDIAEDELPLLADIHNLSTELGDFGDTAAVVMALDLVITIDSVIAHIAGALGRPFWVLLSTGSDWRWLIERQDSPWYPTARLFRQTRPRQWSDVIDRVIEALKGFRPPAA